MIKNSLEKKLSIIYTIVLVIFIIMTLFSLTNIKNASKANQNINEKQNPIIKSINESVIAINKASNAIAFSLPKDNLDDLGFIQQSESDFNDSVVKYNLFTYALLLGSDSQEFKEIHSGLLYYRWKQLGYADTLKVQPVDDSQKETLKQANELFHQFVEKSQKSFALKKRLLRLKINDPLNEYEEVSDSLKSSISEVNTLVKEISEKMQFLSKQTEAIIHQNAIQLQSHQDSLRNTVFLLGMIAILSLSLNMLYLRKAVITPILKLAAIVEKIISSGFTDQLKVDIKSDDEIGKLADAFNSMIDKLKQSYATLEDKVQDKTEELADKVSELEKVNKIMVGRELRMIELKKEINHLKSRKNKKDDQG